MNVLSLFDGISCGRVALERAGIVVDKYYSSEIDKYALQIADKNYPEDIPCRLGDITNWHNWSVDWSSIDLVIGGSPCQGFSIAGVKLGFEDIRSKLFFEYVDILNCIKVNNPNIKFLLENVSMKKEDQDIIDKFLLVNPIKINSDLFVEQNRPRSYWFNWELSELPKRPNWKENYFQWRRTYFRENKSGVCPCLTANMGTGGNNVPLRSMDLKDKLTPMDCERLQTLPYNYTGGVSNTQRYKMLGNGWTVDVIAHILKSLK